MSDEPTGEVSGWTLDSVPAEAMRTWCEALRDDNAIHLDPAAAEALGFGPRTVNPGPTNLAYLMNMVMEARPGQPIRSVEAAMLGNVLAGDSLVARGTWTLDDDPDCCDARLTAHPDARPVVAAHIRVMETK